MRKKTMLATLVLFAIGSMGTCMASQLPHDGNILNLPLPETSKYVAVSICQSEDKIITVAKKGGIKPARKKPKK